MWEAKGILLTQDPIGLAGGVNLYAFAGNNPVAFSDPYGLWPCPELCAAGAAGGSVSLAVGASGITAGGIAAVAAPVAALGGLAAWAALPVVPVETSQVTGATVASDATAVGTGAAVFLTQQAHSVDRTKAQLNVALQHITQIEGLGPNDEDPEGKKRDWTKHAKRALNNARKFAEKVRGKTQDALKREIDDAAERLQQGQ